MAQPPTMKVLCQDCQTTYAKCTNCMCPQRAAENCAICGEIFQWNRKCSYSRKAFDNLEIETRRAGQFLLGVYCQTIGIDVAETAVHGRRNDGVIYDS